MNVILVLFLCFLFFIVLTKIRTKKERLFFFVVCGYWCISLIVSIFNPYNLFKISTSTYFLLVLGFASFFWGYLKYRTKGTVVRSISLGIESVSSILRKKWFRFLYAISLGFIAYLASTQWQVILFQGAIGSLKLNVFELVFGNSSALYFLYQVIMFPMFHLSCILFAYLVLNKGPRVHILLLLLYILLFSFVGGKRGYFGVAFEYFAIVFLLTKVAETRSIKELWKSSSKLIVAGVFVFFAAATMTAMYESSDISSDSVNDSGSETVKSLVIYTVGSYRAFDYGLKNDFLSKSNGFHYGRATFGGTIDYYLSGLLARGGMPIKSVRDYTMDLLQNTRMDIGKDESFNYAFTSFMYFYFDLGIIGIVLFSFLFGYFVRTCIHYYVMDNSLGSLALVCFMFISSIQFCQTWFNISLAAQPTLLLFFYLRKKELQYIN